MNQHLQDIHKNRAALIHHLRMIELGITRITPAYTNGLCVALNSLTGYRDWSKAVAVSIVDDNDPKELGSCAREICDVIGSICAHFEWEYYSGEPCYPIPGGRVAYTVSSYRHCMWTGDGLKYRRHLAGFIADRLEREDV